MKSDTLKTVFVHIPKCGGTSIENVLFDYSERTQENFWMGGVNKSGNKYFETFARIVLRNREPIVNRYQTGGLQHLTTLQIRHALGRDVFESYYRFAVVRHPVKRSLSQYRYMLKRRDLMAWIGMDARDSFLDYLQKTYRRAHVQWEPQISFVNDYLGNRLVHDIVKLENIDADMNIVFKKIGLAGRVIPHLNKTEGNKKSMVVSDDEKAILWELYKEDFEEFDYDIEKY